MASDKTAGRRRYSDELMVEVMAECDAPGASVDKVAMSRGINANVVHRWRQLAREGEQETTAKPHEFVAVAGDRRCLDEMLSCLGGWSGAGSISCVAADRKLVSSRTSSV